MIITFLAFFHSVDTHLSDKHSVYSLANVFEMVFYPAFNIFIFMWSLPDAVAFFIFLSVDFISPIVFSGTSFGPVWFIVLSSLLYSLVQNSTIRSIISSWSYIYILYLYIYIYIYFTLLIQEGNQSVLA